MGLGPRTVDAGSGKRSQVQIAEVGTVKLVSGGPICCPASACQTRTVLSALPETMRLPSGLNATLFTQSVSPVSGAPMGWPVSAFHSRWSCPNCRRQRAARQG